MTLRQLLLTLLAVAMELTAGFTVVLAVGILELTTLGDGSFWLFLAVAWIGALVVLAVDAIRAPKRFERALIVVPGLLLAAGIGLASRQTYISLGLTTFLILLAYWRGAALAAEPADLPDTQRRFASGVALLLVGLILMAARGVIHQLSLWHPLVILGVGYVVLSMLALSVARAENRREPGAGLAVTVAVAVQLVLVVILSFGALLVLTNDFAAPLGALLSPVGDAIGRLLGAVVYVIFLPITWLINLVQPHAHPHTVAPVVGTGTQQPHQGKRVHVHHAPTLPFEIAGIILVLLFALGIIALSWRLIPRLLPGSRPARPREERQWLSAAEIWSALTLWLRSLLHGSAGQTASMIQRARRRILGPQYPRDPVRRLYARLLYRAARAGIPRPEGTTPAEYGRLLAARWPDIAGDIATLTVAYERRRYAEELLTTEEISGLDARWQRVRRVVRPVGQSGVVRLPS